ncbi:MAG: putative lipoprotein [Verrucomicrobiales bacterium]|nr:putative lipoprotein [Verrucomicrobiales bacterium]
MKSISPFLLALTTLMAGCVTLPPPPQWNPVSDAAEAEYRPYLAGGKGSLTGQAFLVQRGGGVVKAAGRNVTLDPATSVGNEWWGKAGKVWAHRSLTPPSPGFAKARQTTVADADGKFKFSGLAAGRYYVRTEVTWEVGGLPPQGGLVGVPVDVRDAQITEVILNQYPQ